MMRPLLAFLLLILLGCSSLELARIPIPELNPAECGCPDSSTRIKITITDGAVFCIPDDATSDMTGDIWPVCHSNSSVKDTQCKMVDEDRYHTTEKVICP